MNDDRDLITLIKGVNNINENDTSEPLFEFRFENDDIISAQKDWMESVYANVIQCDEIINIPYDIWDIIIKQYCC